MTDTDRATLEAHRRIQCGYTDPADPAMHCTRLAEYTGQQSHPPQNGHPRAVWVYACAVHQDAIPAMADAAAALWLGA